MTLGNEDGVQPLHAACEYGYTNITKTLLKKGVDVNKAINELTPLHMACEKGIQK